MEKTYYCENCNDYYELDSSQYNYDEGGILNVICPNCGDNYLYEFEGD